MLIKKIILFPFSLIYGLIIYVRNYFFDKGIYKSRKFDVATVCVGNITVGGTGKTPFTEFLVSQLQANKQIAILSRGYNRKTKGYREVLTSSTATDSGDEPLQMKLKFPEIIVAVSEDRCKGIETILNDHPKVDLVVLDDALQHRFVTPDTSICIVDYNRLPFNDLFLPAGSLREGYSGLKRSSFIVVNKCPNNICRAIVTNIRAKFSEITPASVYFTTIEYGDISPVFPKETDEKTLSIETLKSSKIVLVTGIGNYKPFMNYIEQSTSEVKHLKFADHHNYSEKDILNINKFGDLSDFEMIVTTEKDACRLKSISTLSQSTQNKLFYIPIQLKAVDGDLTEIVKTVDNNS